MALHRECSKCGCGCKGVCHSLYSCNGTWRCATCEERFPTCMMHSLKYLTCAYCAREHAEMRSEIESDIGSEMESELESEIGSEMGSEMRSEMRSEILWRPENDPYGIWDSTTNLYQEIMFLNHQKISESARATEILQKCVRLVVKQRCSGCETRHKN